MNRRKFLKVLGGGAILAAGAATAGFVSTRKPGRALQPWSDAGMLYAEPRRKALSYAILAPNPHNRQPWLVDLSRPARITLYADTDRLLPHTDPFNRQITIGLGCFLELLRMAAAQDGYRANFSLFPDGKDRAKLDERPVAIVTFAKDPAVRPDLLFAHVLARRSLKEPYDTNQPVAAHTLAGLRAAALNETVVDATNDTQMVAALRRECRGATVMEIETPRTYKESLDLFRIGKAEIEANPDGIDFAGPMFEAMHMTGLFTRDVALDRTSSAYEQGSEAVLRNVDTAMAFVWIVTGGNTRTDQINAGRDWLRINLAATAQGLGTQPLSQALQEYREVKPFYDTVHAMLARDGGTVQMLARLGYGETVPPSPRWPLGTRIMGTQA